MTKTIQWPVFAMFAGLGLDLTAKTIGYMPLDETRRVSDINQGVNVVADGFYLIAFALGVSLIINTIYDMVKS